MIRRTLVKQKLLGYFNQPTLYSQYFDRAECVFIHVPKAAGTSIAKAIYGEDPWHYSAQECRFLNRKKFVQYYSFAISRHPVSRIVSSFNYAKTHVKNNPNTSLSFIQNYEDINQFVAEWLNESNIKQHYFFWSLVDYLCDQDKQVLVDQVFKFEQLDVVIASLQQRFGCRFKLCHLNPSKPQLSSELSEQSKQHIYQLYRDDFSVFDYQL